MSRVIFVNRVYWPAEEATAQLLDDLARRLAAHGVPTHVLTASAGENTVAVAENQVVHVHRIGTASERATGLFAKFTSYRAFARAATAWLATNIKPGDTVVFMTDPPLLGRRAGPVVRGRGGRVWHWCQDVYPEVALAIRPFGPVTKLLALYQAGRDREWYQAEKLVAIGHDMAALLQRRGVPADKITVLPNWAPAGIESPSPAIDRSRIRAEWDLSERDYVVGYSGNLGRAHSLIPLIDLAEQCAQLKRVRFVIVGDGAQRTELERQVHQRGLGNVAFRPSVPRASLGASLRATDLQLITMRPDCLGTVWPSKFYGIIATHRPVIFLGPAEAEIAQLIELNHLGCSTLPMQVTPAVTFLQQISGDETMRAMYDKQVARFAKTQPDAESAAQNWQKLLTFHAAKV